MKIKRNNRGFTIIELIIVIAILGILIAVAVVAINPSKQLGDGRNTQRESDISSLVNAVYQYVVDNGGALPPTLTTTPTEVCASGASSCSGLVDLSVLTANQKYLVTLPKDPMCGQSGVQCAANGTGYRISKNANNRVTVVAPLAEDGQTITVTK